MDKKWLIGAKIFGLIFILMAAYFIGSPICELQINSPSNPINPSKTIYRSYQNNIKFLEDFQKDTIAPATTSALKDFQKYTAASARTATSADQILFTKKLEQLKIEAENFRQYYIVQGHIPLRAEICISIGFATCLIFLIAGFGLILNFKWAGKLAMWSMVLNPILYLANLIDSYLLVNSTNDMIMKNISLQAILQPCAVDQLKFLIQDNFKLIFLTPVMWLWFLPLVLWTVCVLYYFNRPQVKEHYQ